jgi:hypothetical protein
VQDGVETAAADEPGGRKEHAGPPETSGVGQAMALDAIAALVARSRAALGRGDERDLRAALDLLTHLLSRLRDDGAR